MIKHLKPRSKSEIRKYKLIHRIKKYKFFIPIIGLFWFIINIFRVRGLRLEEYEIMLAYNNESYLQYIYAFYIVYSMIGLAGMLLLITG
jgi:hypothetical protein